jgi:hypothetical protein
VHHAVSYKETFRKFNTLMRKQFSSEGGFSDLSLVCENSTEEFSYFKNIKQSNQMPVTNYNLSERFDRRDLSNCYVKDMIHIYKKNNVTQLVTKACLIIHEICRSAASKKWIGRV